MLNEGHACPVELNTSTEGSERHFIPNRVQERGKAASQLTLKNSHFKQFGIFVLTAILFFYEARRQAVDAACRRASYYKFTSRYKRQRFAAEFLPQIA
jgi:hypothetical protein